MIRPSSDTAGRPAAHTGGLSPLRRVRIRFDSRCGATIYWHLSVKVQSLTCVLPDDSRAAGTSAAHPPARYVWAGADRPPAAIARLVLLGRSVAGGDWRPLAHYAPSGV